MQSSTRPSALSTQDIGVRLRRIRREHRLTQADLARQIGIQQSDLSRMEKGEYRVSLDNLFKILAVFDIKMADFFGDTTAAQAAGASRPLAREDMQILQMLRRLSPKGRQEAMEFLEFKVRREQTDRRAVENRRDESETG